jgi:hypothetical protein
MQVSESVTIWEFNFWNINELESLLIHRQLGSNGPSGWVKWSKLKNKLKQISHGQAIKFYYVRVLDKLKFYCMTMNDHIIVYILIMCNFIPQGGHLTPVDGTSYCQAKHSKKDIKHTKCFISCVKIQFWNFL